MQLIHDSDKNDTDSKSEEKSRIPTAQVPAAQARPLGEWDVAIPLISKLSQLPPSDVRRRLQEEIHQTGYNVREDAQKWAFEPYVWNNELANFYRNSHSFLFESFIFNHSNAKQDLRRRVASILKSLGRDPKRILVFGDGLGFDSAYFAMAGHQVDYFEVAESGNAFASEVFRLNGVTVRQIQDTTNIVAGTYDVVICLDVLEHAPHPPSLVEILSKALRADGHLIVHAPFWYVAPEVPTHLQGNKKWSGDWKNLYRPFQLYPVHASAMWMPIVFVKTQTPPRTSPFTKLRIACFGAVLKLARTWNGPMVLLARWTTRLNLPPLPDSFSQ
ncbi:MAG: methyltransferase domain-containing protein [Bdellovibrionaceae bacterium]|nr:methyltransferase domain-containing protein [Pseudobdellovibrionaceae bacterium]